LAAVESRNSWDIPLFQHWSTSFGAGCCSPYWTALSREPLNIGAGPERVQEQALAKNADGHSNSSPHHHVTRSSCRSGRVSMFFCRISGAKFLNSIGLQERFSRRQILNSRFKREILDMPDTTRPFFGLSTQLSIRFGGRPVSPAFWIGHRFDQALRPSTAIFGCQEIPPGIPARKMSHRVLGKMIPRPKGDFNSSSCDCLAFFPYPEHRSFGEKPNSGQP